MTSDPAPWWPGWNAKSAFRAALVVVSLAVLGFAVWADRDRLEPLRAVSLWQLAAVLLLTAFAHWLNALEFWLLYRRLGVAIGTVENWLLFTAGQLLNHLPAQVGTLYRFRYLKVVHDTDFATASSGYAANLVITLASTGAVGFGATVWGGSGGDGATTLMLAFGAMVALSVALVLVPLPVGGQTDGGRIRRFVVTASRGWAEVRSDPRTAGAVALLELTKYLVAAWRMQLAFGWLGFDESFAFFLVLAPVAGITSFVGITPAALGFRELGVSGAAVALGRPLEEGLLGATVDRAALFAVSITLGGVGLAYTSRRLRNVAETTGDDVADPKFDPTVSSGAGEPRDARQPRA